MRSLDGQHTESIASDARRLSRSEWAIIIALDCQEPGAWPQRFDLSGVTELSIGRGAERRLVRTGSRARLDLPDRWASQSHARLIRTRDRWQVSDDASKNGTRVNGERIEQETLNDGDVLECGGSYLVLRRMDFTTPGLEPLGDRLEALRTVSPELDRELSVLRKVARHAVPVLVLGESGTGKEGMSAAIHSLSGREGPFVAVNCGAIPSTLVESELFGSRRGAFSGAEDRVGLVRTADRGTLFLDEVAELPLSSQAALLRVLQEKEILPLGASRPIPVDVRVVAATNRPVSELLDSGKLRRDLYARLCGYELRLPELRERLEDLGLLIAAFIARHDRRGTPRTLSRTAARCLFSYPWPLNIRELEQCLSAALAVAGPEIDIEHLPRSLRNARSAPRSATAHERDRLVALLARHGGNLSAVARELATSRSQLYRLLVRHSITAEEMKKKGSTPTPEAP